MGAVVGEDMAASGLGFFTLNDGKTWEIMEDGQSSGPFHSVFMGGTYFLMAAGDSGVISCNVRFGGCERISPSQVFRSIYFPTYNPDGTNGYAVGEGGVIWNYRDFLPVHPRNGRGLAGRRFFLHPTGVLLLPEPGRSSEKQRLFDTRGRRYQSPR